MAACRSFVIRKYRGFRSCRSHSVLFRYLLDPALASHSILQRAQTVTGHADVRSARGSGANTAPPQPLARHDVSLSTRALSLFPSLCVRGSTAQFFADVPCIAPALTSPSSYRQAPRQAGYQTGAASSGRGQAPVGYDAYQPQQAQAQSFRPQVSSAPQQQAYDPSAFQGQPAPRGRSTVQSFGGGLARPTQQQQQQGGQQASCSLFPRFVTPLSWRTFQTGIPTSAVSVLSELCNKPFSSNNLSGILDESKLSHDQ